MGDRVNRTSEKGRSEDSGWTKEVSYKSQHGDTLTRQQGGPNPGSLDFDEIHTSCRNGASLPRDVAEKVNRELRGAYALDLNRDAHTFDGPSPLTQACNVVDKPRGNSR